MIDELIEILSISIVILLYFNYQLNTLVNKSLLKSINLMLQKKKFNLKFPDRKIDTFYLIATALDNTFVVFYS